MKYPVTLTPDSDDTVVVSFPDLPGALTYGEDEAEALSHAVDALETLVQALIADRKPVPLPRRRRGCSVQVPTQTALKILLHNRMIEQGISKSQLARSLRLHRPQIDRLLDVRHGSRLDQLDAALASMGARISATLEELA